jgi:hypothetical protein
MTYNAPPGTYEAVLFQLPDSNLAWLHFLNKDGKEDPKTQIELVPGHYKMLSFADGVVTLEVA